MCHGDDVWQYRVLDQCNGAQVKAKAQNLINITAMDWVKVGETGPRQCDHCKRKGDWKEPMKPQFCLVGPSAKYNCPAYIIRTSLENQLEQWRPDYIRGQWGNNDDGQVLIDLQVPDPLPHCDGHIWQEDGIEKDYTPHFEYSYRHCFHCPPLKFKYANDKVLIVTHVQLM